jgi:branched-chain amino acid transport system substrate-binding protein
MLDRRIFLKYGLLTSSGLAGFPLVGCGGSDNSPTSTAATQALRVGAVLPLSGAWKSVGLEMQSALQLALPTLNQYLLPWNKTLELSVKDSASTPQQALAALKELEAAGIPLAIGPISSAEAPDMLAYANAHNLLLVSPSSSAVSLALPDQLVRLMPTDKAQVDALALRFDAQAVQSVLPVYLGDLYGRDFYQALVQRASSAKFTLLSGLELAANGADYAAMVTQIAARLAAVGAGSAAVLLVVRDTEAVGLLRAASVSNLLRNVAWYGAEGVTRSAAVLADPVAREFAVAVGLAGFTLAVEETIPVVPLMMATGLLSAATGSLPAPTTLAAWDALWLLAEALRQTAAGNTALLEPFKTVVNNGANFLAQRTTLDANGDLKAAKYARFAVHIDAALVAYWRLEGMYIRNAAGTQGFLTSSTAYLTRAGGAVTLGALLPLTGSNASFGLAAQKALHLALEHAMGYFESGQKLGLQFTLDVRDTASNPATALTQLQALQAAGVVLVIGPLHSSELEAVADYAKANQLMLISPTSSAPSLGRPDDLIMRLTPDDTLQAKALTRLITAQGKSALTVLHRNDSYGRELARSVQSQFAGSAVLLPYATDTTDFRPLLAQAAQGMSSAASQALLVIGLGEVVSLLEQVSVGPLTAVAWYGADGISRSRELLASTKAVTTALKVRLTCSVYDENATGFFVPGHVLASTLLGAHLGSAPTWSEFASYDALWLGATAYAMSSAQANSQTLWTTLNNPYGATGAGAGNYVFNKNQDQSLSQFGFYTVVSPAGTPLWQVSAYYRNIVTLPDDLLILPA